MLEKTIIHMFPLSLRNIFMVVAKEGQSVQEIRLRVDRPVIVVKRDLQKNVVTEMFLSPFGTWEHHPKNAFVIAQKQMEELLNHICNYSVYAYDEEIRQGYLTLPGGHRVGLAGQVVYDENCIRTIKYIHFMNIRIAHEIKLVSEKVLPYLYKDGKFLNTLIISPPGCGKTTLLRDIVRQVSDGNKYGSGITVGLVDERSEIAGMYQGIPQNDIGMRTDVLDACPKVWGMMLLIRSLAPKMIAVDELGSDEDIKAMELVMHCGSQILATIHGENINSVRTKKFMSGILNEKVFDRYIVLGKEDGKCVVKGIYDQNYRFFSDYDRNYRLRNEHCERKEQRIEGMQRLDAYPVCNGK